MVIRNQTVIFKRIIMHIVVMILGIGILTQMFVLSSHAADYYSTGEYAYTIINNNSAMVIGYSGNATRLQIPGSIVHEDGKAYAVVAIANESFKENTAIKEVIIPDTVTTIGSRVFADCTSLESVTIGSRVSSWSLSSEDNVYHPGQKANSAFENCTSLKNLFIREGASSVGAYAFYGCTSLQSVVLPDSITSIGDYAFYNCKGITSAIIRNGTIGSYAFANCTALKNLVIQKSTMIMNGAFYHDALISKLELSEELTWIGNEAFAGCSSISYLVIPDKVASIGYAAFYGCSKLTTLVIGSGIRNWVNTEPDNSYYKNGSWEISIAFDSNSSLKNVYFRNGVQSIGSYAFYHCQALESVYLPNSIRNYGIGCFDTEGDSLMLCMLENSRQKDYAEQNNIAYREVKDIASANIEIAETEYIYSGNPYTPSVNVTYEEEILKPGVDYQLIYTANTEVGTANVYVLGIGEYGNSEKLNFNIKKREFDDNITVSLAKQKYAYTGQAIYPSLAVKDGNVTLIEGKDYFLTYTDNVNIGDVSVTITGVGSYSGTLSAQYTIFQECTHPYTKVIMKGQKNATCTDKGYTGDRYCTNCNTVLEKGKEIAALGHSWDKGVIEKAATATETGTMLYTCTICRNTMRQSIPVTGVKSAVTLGVSGATNGTLTHYGKKAFTLSVKTDGDGKLSYTSSNKKVAKISSKGKITVKGYGTTTITIKSAETSRYRADSMTIQVVIKPSAVTLKSVSSPMATALKCTWKKDSSANKYRICISASKKFKGKVYNMKVNKKTSFAVKGLDSGKKYYIRVCSYKVVGGIQYDGKWSKVKSITIK